MSGDYDIIIDNEFATAVAATAYAIYSLEEAHSQRHRTTKEGLQTPMTKVKTRKEEPIQVGGSIRPTPTFTEDRKQKASPGIETKADAWEKAEMAKIKNRYQKLNSTILAWENEKKMRVKSEMKQKKGELDERLQIYLMHYKNKVARIDHIAERARVQAEEKRKYDESKARARAKKIKSTQKVDVKCFCFLLKK